MVDDAVSGQFYRVNEPDVIHQLIDREVVIVDLRNGSYYSVSESGGTAWLAFGSDMVTRNLRPSTLARWLS